MNQHPAIAVTSTTERIRGVIRVRTNEAYTNAARSVGLRPYILPVLPAVDAAALLDGMDGLLLTGGEDVDPAHYGALPHPKLGEIHQGRDEFEIALVRAAHERRLPTLAICRGIQIANVALGGTLIQDISSECPNALIHDGDWDRDRRVHGITLRPNSRLATALGATDIQVNSLHHQAVLRLASGLSAVAHAPDGIVEGAEWEDDSWWFLAAQWHPEELTASLESWDRSLFGAFAAACTTKVSSGATS